MDSHGSEKTINLLINILEKLDVLVANTKPAAIEYQTQCDCNITSGPICECNAVPSSHFNVPIVYELDIQKLRQTTTDAEFRRIIFTWLCSNPKVHGDDVLLYPNNTSSNPNAIMNVARIHPIEDAHNKPDMWTGW